MKKIKKLLTLAINQGIHQAMQLDKNVITMG